MGFLPRALVVPSSLVGRFGPPEVAAALVTLALGVPSLAAILLCTGGPIWDREALRYSLPVGLGAAVLALVIYLVLEARAAELPHRRAGVVVAMGICGAPFALLSAYQLVLFPVVNWTDAGATVGVIWAVCARLLWLPLVCWSALVLWRFLARWARNPWLALGAAGLGGALAFLCSVVVFAFTWSHSHALEPGLVEYQEGFTILWPGQEEGRWTRVTVPLPPETVRQVPVSLEITARPAGSLRGVRLVKLEPPNIAADLNISPPADCSSVRVNVTAHILLAPQSRGQRVLETRPSSTNEALPGEWLRSTYNCQSAAPEILAVAGGFGPQTQTVGETVTQVLQFMRQARRSGRIRSLDAVAALKHNVSCTTAANLVAALLRAREIPARQVRVCSTRGSPQQAHWVVEYFGPAAGWVAIEPASASTLDEPYQYLVVGLVYAGYEENWEPRPRGIARGISRWSLVEPHDPSAWTLLSVAPYSICGERAYFIRSWDEEDPKWDEVVSLSREWHAELTRAIAEGRMDVARNRIGPALKARTLTAYTGAVRQALAQAQAGCR